MVGSISAKQIFTPEQNHFSSNLQYWSDRVRSVAQRKTTIFISATWSGRSTSWPTDLWWAWSWRPSWRPGRRWQCWPAGRGGGPTPPGSPAPAAGYPPARWSRPHTAQWTWRDKITVKRKLHSTLRFEGRLNVMRGRILRLYSTLKNNENWERLHKKIRRKT